MRTLDKGLQEIVLLDGAGNRVWGSNDCFPEASSDVRTLAPGEALAFPLVWGGLTSEPTLHRGPRDARGRRLRAARPAGHQGVGRTLRSPCG